MARCPRGTPSQIKANLLRSLKLNVPAQESEIFPNEEEGETSEASEDYGELDSNRADKRGQLTPQDELVYFFVNCMLDVLVESWESKPCYKAKLGGRSQSTLDQSEEYGELYPCEYPSTLSADYLKDLYTKRSSSFAKQPAPTPKTAESEVNEYDEMNGEDYFVTDGAEEPWKVPPDEDAHVTFTNRVWYRGRLSRRLMDGDGTYFWDDGTCFTGEFVGGWATGKGRVEFASQSVYEGDLYKAFRHGEGIHCLFESPVMYTGQWWLGKKHGEGLIVYNDPSMEHDFYRGQWENDLKEGFGYRQYPSGAKYIGYWSKGLRNGSGVMLWTNNDIYRGEWKDGLMHGYGEYTWNGFVNKTLSYPATNTYRGYWARGKKCGRGTFEMMNDGVIETVWCDDIKAGPGSVVCANEMVVTAENLFRKDRQASYGPEEDTTAMILKDPNLQKGQQSKVKDRPEQKSLSSYLSHSIKSKFISIPVHSSISSINLSQHLLRYKTSRDLCQDRDVEHLRLPVRSELLTVENLRDADSTAWKMHRSELTAECMEQEEKYLRNSISSKIIRLKDCYNKYSTMACETPPTFKCILLRLFLWQMLIDCKIPNQYQSLVDIDELLAQEEYLLFQSKHNPFERIRFGQFIHILIIISWNVYGRFVHHSNPLLVDDRVLNFLEFYQNSESKYTLQMAFSYFVENDLFPACDRVEGPGETREKAFFDSDFAPMEAMYAVYRALGEPHPVRHFLSVVCTANACDEPGIIRYIAKLPLHMTSGANALAVGGELEYIPKPSPLNFPEIFSLERTETFKPETELLFLNGLGPKRVVTCLRKVCPGLECDGYLINMEHKLTFLEFYNALILCTELSLRLKVLQALRNDILTARREKLRETARASASEQEPKQKESQIVSGKRSRQVLEASRKARN